jgi:hypothetical protein
MKKTKLLYIFISAFFVFILNPEKAFSVASSSQIAVNQSFVEKIPESKKEVFLKKIRKIAKFLGVEKMEDITILAKLGFIFSASAIVLSLFALLIALYTLILVLAFLLSMGGLTLGILYLSMRSKDDSDTYKDLAIWAIILSVLPSLLFLLLMLIY